MKQKWKNEYVAYAIVGTTLMIGLVLAFLLNMMHTSPKKWNISEANVAEASDGSYVYGIDSIEPNESSYVIRGFCQKKEEQIKLIDIHCVLYDKESGALLTLPTKWQPRGEVTVEMMENGEDYDKSGFMHRLLQSI